MRIKSLVVKNIKLFDQEFEIVKNVSHVDLVLLNGPNGYGKTTVFDALELALTGEIKRIKTYNENLGVAKNEKYDKKILITDPSKEAYVILTLEEENCEIQLKRFYEKPSNSKKNKASTDNNPHRIFEKFDRKLFINGAEIIGLEEQTSFLKKYHLDNVTEFFDKCCFLSQDEHLQFLKETKKDKSIAMEFLFQLPGKQKEEIDRIDKIIFSLKNSNTKNNLGYIQKLEINRTRLEEEIEGLQRNVEVNQDEEKGEEIEYQCLFSQKGIKWDEQKPLLNDDEYEAANKELDNLIYYAEHQEACIDYIWNKPFQDLLHPFIGSDDIRYESNKLEYAYRYFALIQNENSFEEKYHKQQRLELLGKSIEKRGLYDINWKTVSDEKLMDEDAVTQIKDEIDIIKKMEQTQGAADSIITSLNKTRTVLLQNTRKAIEQGTISDKECPFCGAPYEESKILESKISLEGEKLLALSEGISKDIQNTIEGIYEKYLNKVLVVIQHSLRDRVTEALYKKYQEAKKYKGNLNEIRDLLQRINIPLPEKYQEDITDVSKGYEIFIENIKKNLKILPEDIEAQLVMNKFERDYEKYYDKDETRFRENIRAKLYMKKAYVKRCFYDANRELILNKKQELLQIKKRYIKLNEVYNELCEYRTAINEGVKDYKRNVIYDIEPMLHVYTAKILQQKFCGKSIFILTDEKMENLQLIHSADDNHDILYNMSSGQLAAVSLSFLLCMNQVYAQQQSLPLLLIDDPIQTIDDVNMVGLVDILRFEFKNTQIFISTHEQKFEWYLKYKYEKAGKKMKAYNMKDIVLK